MNIGVLGVGGVGGYFGGKIAHFIENSKSLHKVFFVARGAHLEAICKNGLKLNTKENGVTICRPSLATDDIQSLPLLDICLICVKSYDLCDVLDKLNDRIHSNTVILPLLNGVDIHQRIRGQITKAVILPACVYVGTHIEKPGTVTQSGGSCRIEYGPDPDYPDSDISVLKNLLNDSGICNEWHKDPQPEIWSKFMFIASYGMISASNNITLGQILESQQLCSDTLSIMNEIYKIAIASGIKLNEECIMNSFNKAKAFPYATKTSFQRDFEVSEKKR